jgi:predicted membrane protein
VDNNRPFRFSPQLVVGLVIIFIGVIFTLDNLNLVDARRVLHYWPALLVVYGVSKLADTQNLPGRVWGSIAVLVGSLMLLDRLDLIAFRLHDWWPLVLIGIGGSLLVRSASRRPAPEAAPGAANDASPAIAPAPAPEPGSDSTVSLFALLGGFERTNNSQDFRGGDLTSIMGGCELDLRRASIKSEAVIDIFALWGGVSIKVPEDWSVSVQGFPIMGAIEDRTRPPAGGSGKRLIVKGYAIMGGAEITN